MKSFKKEREENKWVVVDGQSMKGQKILFQLFKSHYWHSNLSFYKNNPEWYLKLRYPSKVHYHRLEKIGWVEFCDNSKNWVVGSFYFNPKQKLHSDLIHKEIKKSLGRGEKYYSWLVSDKNLKKSKKYSLTRYFFKNRINLREDGHYILKLNKFELKTSVSPRLLRSYKRTLAFVNHINWVEASNLDLDDYLKQMQKYLFIKKGMITPTMEQLKAQIKVKHKGLQYYLCSCTGKTKLSSFKAEIVIGILKHGKNAEAKFLHYLDNRENWNESWLSPGTVCHIEIIRRLRELGILRYNLGTFHCGTKSLNEYKSQFLEGEHVPMQIITGKFT